MVVTWVLGLTMVWLGGWYLSPWMHAKFALVIVLSALHGMLVRRWREFSEDRNTRSQKYYRIINEVPAVLMVGIVLLVVLKPF
jgi:putative membrane protein